MDTFWNFSWWWCLIPFAFMAAMMIGGFFLMTRRGGCMGAGRCCGKGETPTRTAA